MRSASWIFLLAFVTRVRSKDLVYKLADNLLDRALKAPALHHTYLDSITFGKPGHHAISRIPSNADGSLRPLLPVRTLTHFTSLPWTRFGPQPSWETGSRPHRQVVVMGRKFENNKLKMAKTGAMKAKKAATIGKKILKCVQDGGPNPDNNLELGRLMKEANAMNVPRDVVDRNIKKATEEPADFQELTYEAYGNEGVAFIINCLSDSRNRANAEVNAAVKKLETKLGGFKMAASGSVLFNFERKGRLAVNKELSEESMIDIAIEAEVDDVELAEPDEDAGDDENVKAVVYTGATDLGNMQAALQDAGYECVGTLTYVPMSRVSVSPEALEKNLAALDRFDEIEDVDSVEHNMQVT